MTPEISDQPGMNYEIREHEHSINGRLYPVGHVFDDDGNEVIRVALSKGHGSERPWYAHAWNEEPIRFWYSGYCSSQQAAMASWWKRNWEEVKAIRT